MKIALITGITGQDGPYLAKFLLNKNYEVYGIYRRSSTPNFWRLQELGILKKIKLIPADMGDMTSLIEAIKISNPDEIYNLAAQSYVGDSFNQPIITAQIDALAPLTIMEIIRNSDKKIKYYQASTSEMFGNLKNISENIVLDEKTPFNPASPYAAAKLYGFNIVKLYREAYGLFACNGILFNHESTLRGLEFVTRKITNSVAKIKLGLQQELKLGDIEPKRDWGYAPDYVKAMWLMLQQDKPDDYVIATNEVHSVKEFLEEAFSNAGLNWEDYVKIEERLKRPKEVKYLKGDYSKAKEKLGWEPKVRFKELVKLMVQKDIERWERFKKGEAFPWDALTYPEDINIIKRSHKKLERWKK